MKNLNHIYAFALLMLFTSCKKSDHPEPAVDEPAEQVIAIVRDSVSYTIDGQNYAAGGVGLNSMHVGGQEANRKLVINDNNPHNYTLVGNPDSVMFYQKNSISTKSADITVTFLRKYLKQKQGVSWMPGRNDILKLFTVGKYALSEDFEWQNTQNGIAIDVAAGSSYNAYNGVNTVVAASGFQKNSTFEIMSFTQATSGSYNLKAKFTATILDAAGKQKKVENGYLQLNFVPWYNIYGN
ncbi:hypothetical protein GCM10023149_45090 [Mucilaginibacter gynuensis]|uniref:Uncharacterized protein n=1 Tax=Mucilaginibacter gynuensis TaxID=1302236 RepID=A0ABP8HA37_9SPHI